MRTLLASLLLAACSGAPFSAAPATDSPDPAGTGASPAAGGESAAGGATGAGGATAEDSGTGGVPERPATGGASVGGSPPLADAGADPATSAGGTPPASGGNLGAGGSPVQDPMERLLKEQRRDCEATILVPCAGGTGVYCQLPGAMPVDWCASVGSPALAQWCCVPPAA